MKKTFSDDEGKTEGGEGGFACYLYFLFSNFYWISLINESRCTGSRREVPETTRDEVDSERRGPRLVGARDPSPSPCDRRFVCV